MAYSKSVFVGNIRAVSVSDSDVNAVRELIISSLAGELKIQIAETEKDSDYSIKGNLVKLGDAYSLTLIKTKESQEIFRSTMKSALMSDMDVVINRLLRSIDEETSVEKNSTVKDVTYDEEKNQRRRKDVLSQWVIGIGPTTTSNLNIDGKSTLWHMGYNYEVDFDWDMHLGLDWLTTHEKNENDAYFTSLNFGLNYYLSRSNFSPYIDFHLGYGASTASTGCNTNALLCTSKDKASGWLGGAGIGFRLFRTSKSNFAIILRGSYLGTETEVSQKKPGVLSLMITGFIH